MIESYSHEQLLAWVNEASDDPCPHILFVSLHQRGGMRQRFLHQTERHARAMAMQMQCFDGDLVRFELHRPARADEIAFEESL